MCDAEIEINNLANGEKEVVLTFVGDWTKPPIGTGMLPLNMCPYNGQVKTFKYDIVHTGSTDAKYESRDLTIFDPLSDGNFVLRYVMLKNGGAVDVKFVK